MQDSWIILKDGSRVHTSWIPKKKLKEIKKNEKSEK